MLPLHIAQRIASTCPITRRVALLGCSLIAATSLVAGAAGQTGLSEDFENVGPVLAGDHGPSGLIAKGWIFRNQSVPLNAGDWVPWSPGSQGVQALHVDMTVSFWQSGAEASSWAILPAVPGQAAGHQLRFHYANIVAPPLVPSARLEVRYSPTGGTGTGVGPTDVGDFTTLLATVPYLDTSYSAYSLSLPGSGRIALRLHVPPQPTQPQFFGGYQIDELAVSPPFSGPIIPGPGQTVTWTLAMSPLLISGNQTIPATATVIVDPGVSVSTAPGSTLKVAGVLLLEGAEGAPVTFQAPSVFPPAIDVNGGSLTATHTDVRGQLRVTSGADVDVADSTFTGNGLIWVQELAPVVNFVRLTGCTFTDSSFTVSDALIVLEENTFVDSYVSILRGYADVTATNTFIGSPFQLEREHVRQPFFLDGVNVSGVSTGGGIRLDGDLYELGPATVSQGNLYPLELLGGLLPGSTVPASGNVNNAIDVASGGFLGRGHWPDLGLPYRLTQTQSGGGGFLTIDPGVTVEAMLPSAGLTFASIRRLTADGLPGAPVTFRSGVPGQGWNGLLFQTNSDTGNRLEWCEVRDANFGAISSDNTLWVTNSLFEGNAVGANANSFGSAYISGSRFVGNATGASFTNIGHTEFDSATNPNVIAGNGIGINGFESGGSIDAGHVWWGDASGPNAPGNPGGKGDSIMGPSASGVSYQPFLTAAPDDADVPPVVRLVEPGGMWSSDPSYFLEPGVPFILHWELLDESDVVSQRVEFSPDGDQPSKFAVVLDGLPPGARSAEIVLPDPGLAASNQPQFLRVVATDGAGQEGWDQFPLTVPTLEITGTWTLDEAPFVGKTFFAGDAIPDMSWTGSSTGFWSLSAGIILESDILGVGALQLGSKAVFFDEVPNVSTDRARLGLHIYGNLNRDTWVLSDYFSIRHDPRFGFLPPTVALRSPSPGSSWAGGDTVPVEWAAAAAEGLRSFDVMASYDAGRTFHYVVRDLPATATSYDWTLPTSAGIPDVRVRVIVRDMRFQNSADDEGIVVLPGGGGTVCQHDLGFGGPGAVSLSVCGEPLAAGSSATLLVQGAPAFAPMHLVVSAFSAPTPFKGGTLVPVPVLVSFPLVGDAGGEVSLPVPGGGGPFTAYVQAVVPDSGQVLGFALSNALQVELLP